MKAEILNGSSHLFCYVQSAKDLIPTYLQKLKELQSKVLSLEEELESLKTLDEETSSVNLENVARVCFFHFPF